jgi:hypothetical protein
VIGPKSPDCLLPSSGGGSTPWRRRQARKGVNSRVRTVWPPGSVIVEGTVPVLVEPVSDEVVLGAVSAGTVIVLPAIVLVVESLPSPEDPQPTASPNSPARPTTNSVLGPRRTSETLKGDDAGCQAGRLVGIPFSSHGGATALCSAPMITSCRSSSSGLMLPLWFS